MKDSPESLFTPKDIQRVRDELIKEQKGIDPILKVPFKEKVTLDHDHKTQRCRGALSLNSNAFEGKVQNAFTRCLSWQTDLDLWQVLQNLADYLKASKTLDLPYHPAWIKRVCIDFKKLKAQDQVTTLEMLKSGSSSGATNAGSRVLKLKSLILKERIPYDKVLKIWQDLEQ